MNRLPKAHPWMVSLLLFACKEPMPMEPMESMDMVMPSPDLSPDRSDEFLLGDNVDDTVKRYDPQQAMWVPLVASAAGPSLGTCEHFPIIKPPLPMDAPAPSCGLDGPRGMAISSGKLYVVSQRPTPQIGNGDLFRYNGDTGAYIDTFVARTKDRTEMGGRGVAPFNGRGMIIGTDGVVYLSDLRDDGVSMEGRVARFQVDTGKYLGDLDRSGYDGTFFPRGLLFGADGLLYVSSSNNFNAGNRLGGHVLRFDTRANKFKDVFITNVPGLNRPEGMTFGPDGNLYVTTFNDPAAAATTTDGVMVFHGKTGALLDRFDFYKPGETRLTAQFLLFGPGGHLYVPISGPSNDVAGEVRRYNVKAKTYDVFTPKGKGLGAGFFPLFRGTHPQTLMYMGNR